MSNSATMLRGVVWAVAGGRFRSPDASKKPGSRSIAIRQHFQIVAAGVERIFEREVLCERNGLALEFPLQTLCRFVR